MEGQRTHHTHRGGLRLGTLASFIVLGTGLAACDTGSDLEGQPQPLGFAGQPEPGLDPELADIDIDALSSETGTAARNEAAARESNDDDPDAAFGTQLAAEDSADASAALEPTQGQQARGDASFIETENGVTVMVSMTGLTPGPHGIHLHENGDCSGPAAEAAGDHFDPNGSPHGAPSDTDQERHAGDLGNIEADSSGNAELEIEIEGLTIGGERGVASKALIVHADEDDLMSQPSGESGDPVACGVVEVTARG